MSSNEEKAGGDQRGVASKHKDFDQVLKPGEHRDAAMTSHPLITDSLVLPTPFVEIIFKACERAVMYNLTGCSFQSPPRFGKTFAARALELMFEKNYPEISVFNFSGLFHDGVISARQFWSDMLDDLEHPAANSHKATTLRKNLINIVVAECLRRGKNMVILLFDEAQEITESQLKYIKGFCNSLKKRKNRIHVVTCFIGQSEFQQRVVETKSKIDLNDRFFQNHRVLYGTRSEEELYEILRLFDDPKVAEYPDGSNISYTEFFLPQAYARGWRLAEQANQMWKELAKANAAKNAEFKMSSIILTIKGFFVLQSPRDGLDFKTGLKEWADAILFSPFEETNRGGKN